MGRTGHQYAPLGDVELAQGDQSGDIAEEGLLHPSQQHSAAPTGKPSPITNSSTAAATSLQQLPTWRCVVIAVAALAGFALLVFVGRAAFLASYSSSSRADSRSSLSSRLDTSRPFLDPLHKPSSAAKGLSGYVYTPPGLDMRICKGSELRCGLINPQPVPEYDFRNKSRLASGVNGMVSADSSRCSDIGRDILAARGNAVDAAVAAALCQGVVNPVSSGIGGGAFIMIRWADGSAEFINARETAPAAANATMYAGKGPLAAIDGGLSVAVPLELKGLYAAWSRWGSLSWSRLVTPAEQLAREGFGAHPYLVYAMTGPFTLKRLQSQPLLREAFLIHNGTNSWRPPYVGELCCQRPRLADTLKKVAAEGPDFLYRGPAAAALAQEVQAAGGILTAADLAAAQVEVVAPLTVQLGPVDLVLPPPPSSAAVVAFCLKFLAGYNATTTTSAAGAASMSFGVNSEADGGLGLQRLVECMKHGFAIRTALGDPGNSSHPSPHANSIKAALSDLLNDTFVQQLRSITEDSGVLDSRKYGGKWNPQGWTPPQEHGTSHLNVVDRWRNAVSITTTVNIPFGSGVLSSSTGILLNDEMDDFAQPNKSSAVTPHAAEANFIAPGRRPLSAMSPMFAVERATGRLLAAAGASGGPLIVSATLQTLVRLLLEGVNVSAAVGAPRIHDQLLPSQDAEYEDYTWGHTHHQLPPAVVQALQQRGQHPVPQALGLGVSQAIWVDYSDANSNLNLEESEASGMAGSHYDVGYESAAGSSSPNGSRSASRRSGAGGTGRPQGVVWGMSDARKDGAAAGY